MRRLCAAAALASACLLLAACGTHIHTGAALPIGSAAIAEAARNAVTVSPLPGTTDASPHTEISFLGPKGTHVLKIDVVASKSNYHAGALRAYANGKGESFLPSKAFTSGETVAVYAMVSSDGHRSNVGTLFRVASGERAHEAPSKRLPTSLRRLASFKEYEGDAMRVMRGRAGTDWVLISEPLKEKQKAPRQGGRPYTSPLVLTDTVLEQLDARTGLVMWEWHALGHIPPQASGEGQGRAERQLRELKIRSVQQSASGRLALQTASGGAIEVSLHTGALEAHTADTVRSRGHR